MKLRLAAQRGGLQITATRFTRICFKKGKEFRDPHRPARLEGRTAEANRKLYTTTEARVASHGARGLGISKPFCIDSDVHAESELEVGKWVRVSAPIVPQIILFCCYKVTRLTSLW